MLVAVAFVLIWEGALTVLLVGRYNFADLPFLQQLLPALVQSDRRVAVATFSDEIMAARSGDRTAIAGASLIEHYMDIAFGENHLHYCKISILEYSFVLP